MTEYLRRIVRQLIYLNQMSDYLNYSMQRVQRILIIANWQVLKAIPELFDYFQRLPNFCADAYGVKPE